MVLIDRILGWLTAKRGWVLVRKPYAIERITVAGFNAYGAPVVESYPRTLTVSWSEPDQDSPKPWGAVWNSTEGWHLGPLDRTESSDQSKLESVPDGYRAWHGRWVYGWSDPSAR